MSLVEELYGQPLHPRGMDIDICRRAWCPFMEDICDGGGNRDMARVPSADPGLGLFFDNAVGQRTGGNIPCGVCSVRLPAKNSVWAICPRRLLSFRDDGAGGRHRALIDRIFQLAGFERGDEVSAWSEISLRETGDDGHVFDYRLDYVLRGSAPDSPPVVVETMTCSTSGGNRARGTDIRGAFRRAVLYAHTPSKDAVEGPGVNTRQVWARMASQMIAKSEAANSWGGRTIWVVQDLLVDYIRTRTALPLDDLYSPDWTPGEVNMIASDLSRPVALYSGPIRPSGADRKCWLELLGTPHVPTLESITKKLGEAEPIGTFRVP